MDTATIGALSAVLGSLVGGTATAATSWMSQRALNRSKQIKDEMRRREVLYGEFISECAKLAVDALAHSLEKPETLLPAYALLNRIRLCASPAVLAEAENVLKRVTEAVVEHRQTRIDVQRPHDVAKRGIGRERSHVIERSLRLIRPPPQPACA